MLWWRMNGCLLILAVMTSASDLVLASQAAVGFHLVTLLALHLVLPLTGFEHMCTWPSRFTNSVLNMFMFTPHLIYRYCPWPLVSIMSTSCPLMFPVTSFVQGCVQSVISANSRKCFLISALLPLCCNKVYNHSHLFCSAHSRSTV